MNEYIKSQMMATGTVTSKDLVCKTCVYRNDSMPTSRCNMYNQTPKPDAVLLGRDCPSYRRKINGRHES